MTKIKANATRVANRRITVDPQDKSLPLPKDRPYMRKKRSEWTVEDKELHRKDKKAARLKTRKYVKRQTDLADGILGGKRIEDWDAEELARGRPRAADGTFRGPVNKFITRAVHEQAIRMFVDHTNQNLRCLVPMAMSTIEYILQNDEEDKRGRPLVPAATKLACAQWVVEHVVGKTRQPVDLDISVKLQGILANVMVAPSQLGGSADPARASIKVPELMPAIGRDFVDAAIEDEDPPTPGGVDGNETDES